MPLSVTRTNCGTQHRHRRMPWVYGHISAANNREETIVPCDAASCGAHQFAIACLKLGVSTSPRVTTQPAIDRAGVSLEFHLPYYSFSVALVHCILQTHHCELCLQSNENSVATILSFTILCTHGDSLCLTCNRTYREKVKARINMKLLAQAVARLNK